MKKFKSQSLVLCVCVVSLCFPPLIYAANDDEYDDGGDIANGNSKTPEEKAISAYNKGLKKLNAAWIQAQKSKTLADEKEQERLENKAQKLFDRSIKYFNEAVKHDPELYQAHSNLGLVLCKTGALNNSLAAYERALSIKSDYYAAIEYLAENQLQMHQFSKVQSAYIRLTSEQPKYAKKLRQVIIEWKENLPKSSESDPALRNFDRWFLTCPWRIAI